MSGGLAAWLDDDSKNNGKKHARGKRMNKVVHTKPNSSPHPRAAAAAAAGAAEVAASTAAVSSAQSNQQQRTVIEVDNSETTRTAAATAAAAAELWDPFHFNQSDNTTTAGGVTTPAKPNAFARLLEGAMLSASKQTSPADRNTHLPVSAAVSAWDPFASGGDGKENNAFSKMLTATTACSSNSDAASTGTGGAKGARSTAVSAGKRKRPVGGGLRGWSGGAMADVEMDIPAAAAAAAATRFCECPVCGKSVIIELCSKHLDTECAGASLPPPTSSAPQGAQESTAPGIHCNPALAKKKAGAAASERAVSVARPPIEASETVRENAAVVRVEIGERVAENSESACNNDGDGDCGDDRCSLEATVPEHNDIGPNFGRRGEQATLGSSLDNTAPPVSWPFSPTTLANNTASLRPPAQPQRRRRSSKRGAGDAVRSSTAAVTSSMTSCPVCGKRVRADLCSHHLDTQCTGISADAVGQAGREGPEQEVRETKTTASSGASAALNGNGGAGETMGMSGGANGQKSEAAVGMTALAAELTCPVCLCIFEDPHTLPCSHRFCLPCITDCFKSSKKQECPLCKVPAWRRDLKRDVPLQNIIQAYRRMAA